MEKKHGLPPGTLKRIRFAERSNADQTSETGAKSVYQFVPGTRRNFKRKYGVDAWAGPEQSVEAAALHIKESLDRGRGMDGALRDYRGVDESADPGWYRRARGGASGGGGGGGQPIGDTGSRAYDGSPIEGYEVPQAQHVEVPNAPSAPTPVARPSLGQEVSVARMQAAQSLLGNPNVDASAFVGAMGNVNSAQAFSDLQDVRNQREKDSQALTQTGYQAELQNYNTINAQNNRGEWDDHLEAIKQNYGLDSEEYKAAIQATRDQWTEQQRVNDREDTQYQQSRERMMGNVYDAAKSEASDRWANYRALLGQESKDDAAEARRQARMDQWLGGPQGQAAQKRATEGSAAAAETLTLLDQFDRASKNASQGGVQGWPVVGGVARGIYSSTTGNEAVGEMDNASTKLGVLLQDSMKGSTSDSDREWLQRSLPSRQNGYKANVGASKAMRRMALREGEYWAGYNKAIGDGGPQALNAFQRQWDQYINDVSVKSNRNKAYRTYEQWVSREVVR
jgi:hypothetical protein